VPEFEIKKDTILIQAQISVKLVNNLIPAAAN